MGAEHFFSSANFSFLSQKNITLNVVISSRIMFARKCSNISFSDGQQTNKQTRLVVTSKVLHVLALEEGLSLLKKLLQAIRKIKPPVFCYVIYSPLCYNMSDGRKLTLYSFEVLPTGAARFLQFLT